MTTLSTPTAKDGSGPRSPRDLPGGDPPAPPPLPTLPAASSPDIFVHSSDFKTRLNNIEVEDGSVGLPFVVRWAEGDPGNPLFWSASKKWPIVAIVATEALCKYLKMVQVERWSSLRLTSVGTTFASSVFTGGLREMAGFFRVGPTVITLGLSLYLFGFA